MSENGGEARGPSSCSSSLRHYVYQRDGNGTAIFFGHLFVVVTFQCQRKAPIKLYQA